MRKDKTMQVLHFYKTSFPDTMGGVEQVINQIARGANKLGVKTDVLSLTPERVQRTIEIDGYSAHRCRRAFKFDHLCALNFDQG